MNELYGIALTGLNASQLGLTTTGHNISNANTEGYSRQRVEQGAGWPLSTPHGQIGTGTVVETISRAYDQFALKQMQGVTAQSNYFGGMEEHLRDLDNLVADTSVGLSPSIQTFFSGVQTVANDPRAAPSRQALLGYAQQMVAQVKTLDNTLQQIRTSTNREVEDYVKTIGSIAEQIADFNQQIVVVRANGNGQPPNDLLDKRDLLVTQLNKFVNTTVLLDKSGSYSVFIGNGQSLVVGNTAYKLAALPALEDPQKLRVAYTQFDNTVYIPDDYLTGGKLGAVLHYRNGELTQTQNAIGRTMMALTQNANTQHKLGIDLDGEMGTNLFQFAMEEVHREYGIGENRATLSVTNLSNTPYISSDFNLARDETGEYWVTRLSDGATVQVVPAASLCSEEGINIFGLNFRLEGEMAEGEDISLAFYPAVTGLVANSRNKGDAVIEAAVYDTNLLSTSDYTLQIASVDDDSICPPTASRYVLKRENDGKEWVFNDRQWRNPPLDQHFEDGLDGLRFTHLQGEFQAGDRFLIRPTRDFSDQLFVGITDTAKIAAGYSVRTSGDTAWIQGYANPLNRGEAAFTVLTPVIEAQGGVAAKKIELIFKEEDRFDIVDAESSQVLKLGEHYTSGEPIEYNGWSVCIEGSPRLGDRFIINPLRNTGNAEISLGKPTVVPLDLNLINRRDAFAHDIEPVAIRFTDDTHWQLLDPRDGTPLSEIQRYTSGDEIPFRGWSASLSGTPRAGDIFMLIEANTGGVSDSRNMLALGHLQTANLMARGGTNFQGAYSQMVADIGVVTSQTNINSDAQKLLLRNVTDKLSSTSGVNLDEEATNLLIYQQSYQACSRAIQAAQTAFNSILQVF